MNIHECGFARRDFLRVTGVAGLALGFNLQRCLAEALRPDCGIAGAEAEMPIKELIVGLEIGASKVCAVVGGRQFDDKSGIFGVGQARSRGMRGGRIVDSAAVGKCVREALVDAEEKSDVMIRSVRLAVTGWLNGVTHRGLVDIVRELGVEVEGVVFSSHASAEAVLDQNQKGLGALVVDMGGGASDYIVYVDGAVKQSGTLDIGGDHITKDISLGLRIPMARAERLKIEEGSVRLGQSSRGERIVVADEHGFYRGEVEREMLDTIIHRRVRETFEMVRTGREASGVRLDSLAAGVHLTGGCSMLPGIDALAREIFGMPVRLAHAKGCIGAASALANPRYACAIGLVKLDAPSNDSAPSGERGRWRGGLMRMAISALKVI